jgi:hypothetical protein
MQLLKVGTVLVAWHELNEKKLGIPNPETKDIPALMLLLRHYLSLAEEGIDVSEVQYVEDAQAI